MQAVQKAFVVMMMVTGACAGIAEAAGEPTSPGEIRPGTIDLTPWAGPTSPLMDQTLAATAGTRGPASDAVEAIPTPSAMNLGAGGLALLAATRVVRRIRLAA